MNKLVIGLLALSSLPSYAKTITSAKNIEEVLAHNVELTNKITAKSLSRAKLIHVDKVVTRQTSNIWQPNGSGHDCTLNIKAFSRGELVGQISRIYSDSDCPRL